MPNALMMPPPAPQTQAAQPQGGMPPGNPLQAPPQEQQAPAPTHAQTVCTLRHFNAVEDQLEFLLKNPDLGKSDVKKDIIEAATKLVASRIMESREAVNLLSTVPSEPFKQRQWVEKHLQDIETGREVILQHHAQAFAGVPEETIRGGPAYSPDEHMSTIKSLLSTHYKGKQ